MRAARALALVLVVALSACASARLPREELSASAIALTYWEPEAARQRAELLGQMAEDAGPRRGMADLNSLVDRRSAPAEVARRYPGHLVLFEPHTGKITPVEQAPKGAIPLAWSEDGTKLLFTSAHVKGRYQIYQLDRGTGDVRAVTRGEMEHLYADYGREGRVAYSGSQMVDGQLRIGIWLTEPGLGKSTLVVGGQRVHSLTLAPDAAILVYVRPGPRRSAGRTAGPVLIAHDLAGGAGERMLGRGRDPVFTRDGHWVVYSASVDGSWRLRRVRPDGSARASVGGSIRDERMPAVSPDGNHVVYVAREGGIDQLFVRRMDGSGDRILVDRGGVANPVW